MVSFTHLWIQDSICSPHTNRPTPKALVICLGYQRIGWAGVAVPRERAVLISIVACVTKGDAAFRITIRGWIWSGKKKEYITVYFF